jgi:hypothetical protein
MKSQRRLSGTFVFFAAAALASSLVFTGCNGGNGLAKLPPVSPAQVNAITSRVKATDYYVVMHPSDAPDLATLRTLHDQWHARGIRMDYVDGDPWLYDALITNALAAGLKILLITPYTTPGGTVDAYAQAVGTAARRYAGRGLTWEIYNEPDSRLDKSLGAGLAGYITLAKATANAIRANDPGATILTGGTSGIDSPHFTFAIAAAKALAPYVDGASIHPYGIDYGSFGSAVAEVATATGLPVYLTEWGDNDGQGLAQAMASAKGLTAIFGAYEYQEQASEIAAGDPNWGLKNTGAWQAFAAAAQ